MTKVKPRNRNETKSDIFPWDIFRFDSIFVLSKSQANYKKISSLVTMDSFSPVEKILTKVN